MSITRIILATILIVWGLGVLLGFSVFRFIFALILIFLGLRLIAGKRTFDGEQKFSQEDYINDVAIFAPFNKTVKSSQFRGGKATMIFGGGQLDLSQSASAKNEIEMDLDAVFGGLKVIVPGDWSVRSQGTAILGGFDNKASAGTGNTTLTIRGAAVFGGIEIVN